MNSKKEPSPILVDQDVAAEKEKSLYLIQIGYLTKELERYQLKSEELKTEIKEINSEFRAMEVDNKDIQEYLVYTLAKLSKREEEMNEQLEQEQAGNQNWEAQKLLRSQEKQELERRREELKAVTTRQAARLEEQKQQLEQLDRLLSTKKSEAQAQMKSLKEEHERAIQDMKLEEENLIKRKQEELNRCMELRVSAIIQEERAQHKEVIKKAESLLRELLSLKVEKKRAQNKQGILCPRIDNLKNKLRKYDQDILSLEKEKEKLVKMCQLQRTKNENLISKTEALTLKQASASAECRLKRIDKNQLEAQLQKERRRRRQLEGDMKKAVHLLSAIISDPEEAKNPQLMLKLQKVLESPGPQQTGSTDPISGGPKPQTSDTKASAETEAFEKNPLFLLSIIRPGDLGLIPRPTWNQKIAHTQKPHQEVKQPQIGEPLWRKAFLRWVE